MDSNSFDELKKTAKTFVRLLLVSDYKAAVTQFDKKMSTVMSETELQEAWQNITAEAGTLLELTTEKTSEMESYKIVIIKCHFQLFDINVQIVFNKQEQISGLNFMPVQMVYNPPEYVNESTFHEVDVTVGNGKWSLPGTMTLPNGPGPFVGIVLVHGSGPNDRDETIGLNKPFRDLAWGLASQGVAVLRYDKRTLKHAKQLTPDLIATLTVKEEVIDDALLAIELMRQNDNINSEKIFVLGHSLGATVAPRIGYQDPKSAGLIIMAGITRSLEDTILDQYTYLYSLSGTMTNQQKEELETLKAKVNKLKDPELSDNISSKDLPFGVPIAYWRDLQENKPLDVVKNISMPILILQGERDYQVLVTKDFEEGWKKALSSRKNVKFKLFPKLNHLFIAGEGKSTPQEYNIEGHVDVDVIKTIIDWIGKQ
jgi:uncharacterized protein